MLVSTDAKAMAAAAASFDFLLNTIPVGHDVNPYLSLLKRDRTMVMVGVLTAIEPPLSGAALIFGRKNLTGSGIGGMAENPGDDRFLRPAQYRQRYRDDPDPGRQQGLMSGWSRMMSNTVS